MINQKWPLFNFLFVVCLLIQGCHNDDQSAILPPAPGELRALQIEAFDQLKQYATLDVDSNGDYRFISEAGVDFRMPQKNLEVAGGEVSGPIDLEFVEIFDRGTMLVTNATTVGRDQNGNLRQLISAGEFYTGAMQDGRYVQTSGNLLFEIPADLTGGERPGMESFIALSNDIDESILWIQLDEYSEYLEERRMYSSLAADLGWFNCDAFVSDSGPKTPIEVVYPHGYDEKNSKVYLAREGEGSSLAYLFGEFPIGLKVHLIFTSAYDGKFSYAIRSITLEENQHVTFHEADLDLASTESLKKIINDLP